MSDATALGRKALLLLTVREAASASGVTGVDRAQLQRLVFIVQTEAALDVRSLIAPEPPYSFDTDYASPYSAEISRDLEDLTDLGWLSVWTTKIGSEGKFIRLWYSLKERGQKVLDNILLGHESYSRIAALVRKYASVPTASLKREMMRLSLDLPEDHPEGLRPIAQG